MYYTQIVMHLFSMSNKSHHVMGHETDQRIANLPQLDELDQTADEVAEEIRRFRADLIFGFYLLPGAFYLLPVASSVACPCLDKTPFWLLMRTLADHWLHCLFPKVTCTETNITLRNDYALVLHSTTHNMMVSRQKLLLTIVINESYYYQWLWCLWFHDNLISQPSLETMNLNLR